MTSLQYLLNFWPTLDNFLMDPKFGDFIVKKKKRKKEVAHIEGGGGAGVGVVFWVLINFL